MFFFTGFKFFVVRLYPVKIWSLALNKFRDPYYLTGPSKHKNEFRLKLLELSVGEELAVDDKFLKFIGTEQQRDEIVVIFCFYILLEHFLFQVEPLSYQH